MRLEERWLRGSMPNRRQRTEPKQKVPKMPSGLNESEQRIWKRLVPRVAKLCILDDNDLFALVDLCRCLVRLEECERDISERGLLIEGERGPVKNPSCQLARQYRDAFARWCQRFGLSPADRTRLDIPERPGEPDPLEEFLTRAQNDRRMILESIWRRFHER
jgi:P27 family predicted phage terminase small subunit